MSRHAGPVIGLLQHCERPGHWVIEGWDVRKAPPSSPHYGFWVARLFGETFERRTLALVREEILNRRES